MGLLETTAKEMRREHRLRHFRTTIKRLGNDRLELLNRDTLHRCDARGVALDPRLLGLVARKVTNLWVANKDLS